MDILKPEISLIFLSYDLKPMVNLKAASPRKKKERKIPLNKCFFFIETFFKIVYKLNLHHVWLVPCSKQILTTEWLSLLTFWMHWTYFQRSYTSTIRLVLYIYISKSNTRTWY